MEPLPPRSMLPRFFSTRRALGATLALGALTLPTTFAAAAASNASTAAAPAFPGKPVRIITPFPVGGGPDGVARLVADGLARRWGQPVVVENRPGGNGFIAIDAFKRAPQDGTTLMVLDSLHLSAYPSLFKKLPYDPQRDFTPLTALFKTYFFITVPQQSPYPTVGALLADAKARPGQLNYGSWSVGSPVHLGAELLAARTGTRMQHVVFKETSQLYTSVSTGDLHFSLGSIATAGPLQRAGKLRFLAIAAPQRAPEFPDVPTVAESGGPQGFEVTGWNTLVAPPGLPAAVTAQIRRDAQAALDTPEARAKFQSFGYAPFPTTRQQLDQFIADERLRFEQVIRQSHISLD